MRSLPAPPTDRPLRLGITMWWHTPMFHVTVTDTVAACGRNTIEPTDQTIAEIPGSSICPGCRPYTGVALAPRPERQWVSIPGHGDVHVRTSERGTACGLWCAPEDYARVGPLESIADSDLDDVTRCPACVRNQDYRDSLDGWRYLPVDE